MLPHMDCPLPMQPSNAAGRPEEVEGQQCMHRKHCQLSTAACKAWCSDHSLHEERVTADALLLNVQPSLF